jgi:hypothetical protein
MSSGVAESGNIPVCMEEFQNDPFNCETGMPNAIPINHKL